MDVHIVGVLVALLFAALFAGSETAFLSFSKFRIDVWLKQGKTGAKTLRFLVDRPERFLTTALVGNNLANVIYSSLLALYLSGMGVSENLIFIITPLVVLLFGESVPKSIARQKADGSALPAGLFIRTVRWILYPVVVVVEWVVRVLGKKQGKSGEQGVEISRDDVELVIKLSHPPDQMVSSERNLLEKTIELGNLTVGDIMTPRMAVTAIPITEQVETARKLLLTTGLSRLPCYEEDLDHTLGMISAKDLISDPVSLRSVLRPLPMVPEAAEAVSLVKFFRTNKSVIAGVVDEYGGFAGLVTLEDMLEELLGPISDEYDRDQLKLIKLEENRWIAPGVSRLSHLNQALGIHLPRTHNSSVGGLITEIAGEIPREGTEFHVGDCLLKVMHTDQRGVKQVMISCNAASERNFP